MIADKSILITGGTGSFGHAFVKWAFMNDRPRKIVIFSRDEHKQEQMQGLMGAWASKVRFQLGDVRDLARLKMAMKDIDIVIHAAALKHVDLGEYNPMEVTRTNIMGTENVISAAIDGKVEKVIYLSTDKAVMPINQYGCSKAVAEKLVLASNYYKPIFNVIRYGNVMGSRGSVLEKFLRMRALKNDIFPITNMECTRFWIDFKDAIQLCVRAIDEKPGTILVSKMNSFRVKDLIKAIYLRAQVKEVGLRPGEKIHECLINEKESRKTYDNGTFYRILPEYVFGDSILYDTAHGTVLGKPLFSNDACSLKPLDWVREKVSEYIKEHADD